MNDLRYALRSLLKTRGFTVVAVLTMAIAIGACTALFSVMHAVVLRPLPYPEPDRLVSIWALNPERGLETPALSWNKFEHYRERTDVFSEIAMTAGYGFTLTEGLGEPELVFGLFASARFLPILGLPPSQGRSFTAEEDREDGPAVVMISHRLWENRFGSDPEILGRALLLDGVPRVVVGVLPRRMPVPFDNVEILVPRPDALPFLTPQQRNNAIVHAAYARLAPRVSVEQANRRLVEMLEQFRAAYPGHLDSNNTNEVRTIGEQVVGDLRRPFWILAGAVAAVLFIACANIANLFLARVSSRQKEIAVRMSLGARRGAVIRQFMTESLVFVLIAGGLGVLIAWWSIHGIQILAGPQLPRSTDIALNAGVLIFALGTALLAALLIGLYPAVQASRTDMHAVMKEGGRGAGGGARAKAFRHLLVIVQVALSLTLLVSAGLLVRSFDRLQTADLGFAVEGRAVGLINLPAARYADPAASREFFRELQVRLDQAPELAQAGGIFGLPLSGLGSISPYVVQGRAIPAVHERPLSSIRYVTPGYFSTMGIRLKEGRFFTSQDRFGGEDVAVINATFARKLFPGESAVGHAFLLGPDSTTVARIVGVVDDVKANGVATPAPDEIYYPRDQRGNAIMVVVGQAQPGLTAAAVIPALRRVLAELDPTLALANPGTLEDLVAQNIGLQRLTMALLICFAATAALLASVGVYSVMAYSVTQRTGEIGVRMALGASTRSILGLILRSGAGQVGTGLVLGLVGAVLASQLLRQALYEVHPFDPLVFLTVALGFAGISALACLVPARRAARVDPVVALRED